MAIKKLELDLREHVGSIDLRAKKNILSKILQGDWAALLRGRGLEFVDYRKYTTMDDASRIDWKASLRAKETLVKEYKEEKGLDICFLFDVSNSMLFSSHNKLKCEYAAEMIASVSYAALKGGDAVGLVMFNENIVERLNVQAGRGVHPRIVRSLSNPELYGGNFDLKKALKFTSTFVKDKSVLIIVSDFIGLEENWFTYLNIASRKYDILGFAIRDPRDDYLPELGGQFMIQDPFSNETMYMDTDDFAKEYNKAGEDFKTKLKRFFHFSRSSLLFFDTSKDFSLPIRKFFKQKAKLVTAQH